MTTTAKLRAALNEGLGQFIRLNPGNGVSLKGRYPDFELTRVDLDSAQVDPMQLPPTPGTVTQRNGKLTSQQIEVSARPLRIGEEAKLEVELRAGQAEMEVVTDRDERRWLALVRARDGHARLDIGGGDIEELFLSGARLAAKEHGVTIDHGAIQLSQVDPRNVRLEAEVTARKLFMKSNLWVTGGMRLDNDLNAHFYELTFSGKGTIGGLVARLANPYLEEWEKKPFPLMGLLFSEIKLHDLHLKIGRDNALHAQASFGE